MAYGLGLLGILLIVVPFWRLLPTYGFPAPLALVAVIPPLAVILLWLMAFNVNRTGEGS